LGENNSSFFVDKEVKTIEKLSKIEDFRGFLMNILGKRGNKSFMADLTEISKNIIDEEIINICERYKYLKELFAKNNIPDCMQIKETIKNLEKIELDIKYPNLKSEYKWLKNYHKRTIYIFSVNDFPFGKSEIEEKFKKVKEKNISLCRINEKWENTQNGKTMYLYVGSSENIVNRLKEHLFLCNPTTYAMHLDQWFPKDIKITIDTWDFNDFLSDEDSEYLQIIEDFLWSHYKPFFGRQGKK
jgi:hypothetical protein